MPDNPEPRVVLARVALPGETKFEASNHRVEAWSGGRRLASALTNKEGRIEFKLKKSDCHSHVELRVFAPWGTEIQRRTLKSSELGNPRELLLRAALPPDILSADGTGTPVNRKPGLVSRGDMDLFHAVTALAASRNYFPQSGGPLGPVDRIYDILGELESIYHWADGALRGDAGCIQSLKIYLNQEHCSETGHHEVTDGKQVNKNNARGFLTIERAEQLQLAGTMLDALDADVDTDGNEHSWTERAQCYFLGRAAVIQQVFGAAAATAAGTMDPGAFASLFTASVARAHHDQNQNQNPNQDQDYDEFEPAVALDQWDDAMVLWARQLESLQATAKGEMGSRDLPLLIGRVEPPMVAQGSNPRLTLFPAEKQFPVRPQGTLNGFLALWQNGVRHELKILRWDRDAIEIEMPDKLPPGRSAIYWELPSRPFTERVFLDPSPTRDGPAAQGRPDEYAPPPYRVPGQVDVPVLVPYVNFEPVGDEVVGERSVNIPNPGGPPQSETERFIRAESCTDVVLGWGGGVSWSSEPVIYASGSPASVSFNITVLANGEIVQRSTSASGEIHADLRNSTSYEIQLEAHVGAISLGTARAALSVERYARIRLGVTDRIQPLNRPVRINVRLSCPAPAGLRVRLTSSNPRLLTSNVVTMPANHDTYTADLMPAGGNGPVSVTATAPGHELAVVGIQMGESSAIRFCGMWQRAPISPTVVGVHIAVLHTGKVLLFNYHEGHFPVVAADGPSGQWLIDILSTADSNRAHSQLWDPITGEVATVSLNRNLFCSGLAFLPDGRLFIASGQFHVPVWQILFVVDSLGPLLPAVRPDLAALLPIIPALHALVTPIIAAGHNYDGADKDLHLFRPDDNNFERVFPNMEAGRWYPTCVTLPNGKVMIISGTSGALSKPFDGGIQDTFEIFDPEQPGLRHVVPLGFHIRHLYPFMHVLPSGRVFVHYFKQTALFNPATEEFDLIINGTQPVLTNHDASRTGPGPGTSVLLPLVPTREPDGEVSYPAGRILILGGGCAEGTPEPPEDGGPVIGSDPRYRLAPDTPATNTAEIMDFSAVNPVWSWTAPMRHPRVMPDSVLLPNGKVLVVNGARVGMAGAFGLHLGDLGPERDPVLQPELFDPETDTWESMCPMTIPRVYHATAALLPDGRVLVAGHDGMLNNYRARPGQPPLRESKYQLEIFSPPYLFRGARPIIDSAPSVVRYRSAFQIEISTDVSEIQSVCLIRQSSVTHQINTDQRYVGLAIIPTLSRTSVMVQGPPDANIAPPGFYMLFVVNRVGVPSVAKWLRIRPL